MKKTIEKIIDSYDKRTIPERTEYNLKTCLIDGLLGFLAILYVLNIPSIIYFVKNLFL